MPTSYNGDKTQTQAPSDPPEPGGSPLVQIPADGDFPNASTWQQAFRVLADFIHWLMHPQAVLGGRKWIQAWQAVNGHQRFAVDHMGFPAGQVTTYEANWRSSPAISFPNPSGTDETQFLVMPEWRYKALQSSGSAAANMGFDSLGASLLLVPGNPETDYVTCSTGYFGILRADNHVALDTAASVPGSASRTFVVGLSEAPASTMLVESAYIGFRVLAGGTLWQCVTRAAGVETVTTSAVTANVTAAGTRSDRLRIEWHGETVADDSVRSVRFYINGTLVATHTTNLPVGMGIGLAVSDARIAGGGADVDFSILRPMRLRVSLCEQDAVF